MSIDNKYKEISEVLGVRAEYLEKIDQLLVSKSNKRDVFELIIQELEQNQFKPSFEQEIFDIDRSISSKYGPNISAAALSIYTSPKGFFIRREKAVELLKNNPPLNLLDYFHYSSVDELMDKEGFESVMSSLRFTQTDQWMHSFFDTAYGGITSQDFEDRDVQIVILDPKWPQIAEKFLKKKLHNVSHLKEFGIIFVIQDQEIIPGETLRTLLLLLHYLHEVPFYSGLLRRYASDHDFVAKLQSLLRGDVLDAGKIDKEQVSRWPIIQRYLAKDDPDDPRLFIHHVNPEAEHWYLVGQDLRRVESKLGIEGIGKWSDTDWTGSNLIDLVMTTVKKGEVKYLYHRREAMWNRVFAGHLGRDTMNALVEENIIKGYIDL
ncbi:MAG TPA: hypothetical protein VJJ72_02585 [Candidatus Paceibacterota bacterium]